MIPDDGDVDLTGLVDGTLAGPEWDAWLAAHPEAAAEVAIARRVHAIIAQLQYADIELPAHFEAQVLARVRSQSAILDLLDWMLRFILKRVRFDAWVDQRGLGDALHGLGIARPLSDVAAQIVFILVILSFTITATRLMGLEPVAIGAVKR
jgi:hypothetical protein